MEEKQVKRRIARNTAQRRLPPQKNRLTSDKLAVLITVVNRTKADFYIDLIQSSAEANLQFSTVARGTANMALLNKLGITDTDKTVIFSIIKDEKSSAILSVLDEKFKTIKNGNGIAYTIPMESIIGVSAFAFLANKRQGGLFDGSK